MILLTESDVINTNETYNSSRYCLKVYRNVVYELEKVSDILLQVLERKNSSDVKIVRDYKNQIEGLKRYCLNELDDNKFQVDIKEAYAKIFTLITLFPKSIINVAKRNDLEAFSKYVQKIPSMTLTLMDAFNKFIGSSLNTIQTNIQSVNESLLMEDANTSNFVAGTNTVYDMGSNFYTGVGGTIDTIINLFRSTSNVQNGSINTQAVGTFGGAYEKATNLFDRLVKDWKDVRSQETREIKGAGAEAEIQNGNYTPLSLSAIGKFMTTPSFMQTMGAISVCAATFFGLRWIWRRLRRAFSSTRY